MQINPARMSPSVASRAAVAGAVVVCSPGGVFNPRSHESVTRTRIAERLAALKGWAFGGEYDPARPAAGRLYIVPAHTVVGQAVAERMGIRDESDFFGGVVPHAFVATKAITHGLVTARARAPSGWRAELAPALGDAVLDGYTVFAVDDAERAGRLLLERGPVRLKRVCETGGRGQSVVRSAPDLDAAIMAIDEHEISRDGLVLEQDLADVTTYSVGQVRVDGNPATYYGTQALTRNHHGVEVYGGSSLIVVNGDYDALLALPLPPDAALAVTQARAYDAAVSRAYPGLLASRRNYDIASGSDAAGMRRSGVLEQSWRIGGASGAEVGALEAFQSDPAVRVVRATCTEVYGEDATPPAHATVYFRGEDEKVGYITKYTVVEPYAAAR
jgi:hypothetical protein